MAASNSLERVNLQLNEAQTNIETIQGIVVMADEMLSDTIIVYEVLDRTVGDELFAEIVAASNTIIALRDSVISLNEILESLGDMPFIHVPTLTEELDDAAERMTTVQNNVEALRTELRAVKEEAISKPVTAITFKTSRVSDELEATQQNLSNSQAIISEDLQTTSSIKARIPGIIDLSSVMLSFIFLWLALGLAGLIVVARNGLIVPMNSGIADNTVSASDE